MTAAPRRFQLTALGNAPVDVLAHVDDTLLTRFGLKKGDWQSISADKITGLRASLGPVELQPGGSAANTVYSMARLGSRVNFIGLVGNDDAGRNFYQSMARVGVGMPAPLPNHDTFVIYVLITPDGERTFATTGLHPHIARSHIDDEQVAASDWLMIEGYALLAQADPVLETAAIARRHGVKIALTLAAPFVVKTAFASISALLREGVDLLIANGEELDTLISAELAGDTTDHAVATMKALQKTPQVVTHGSEGAAFRTVHHYLQSPCPKELKPIDTNGAGDAFAAGFLHGLLGGHTVEKALNLGHALAGRTILQTGARLREGFEAAKAEAL